MKWEPKEQNGMAYHMKKSVYKIHVNILLYSCSPRGSIFSRMPHNEQMSNRETANKGKEDSEKDPWWEKIMDVIHKKYSMVTYHESSETDQPYIH